MKKLSVLIALIFILSCCITGFAQASGLPGVEPNTLILEANGQIITYELYAHQVNEDGSIYTMYTCTDGSGNATGFNIITTFGCGVYACSLQSSMVGQFANMTGGETRMAECGPNGGNGEYGAMDMCLYVNEAGHYCGVFFVNDAGSLIKGMFDLTLN